MHRGIRLLRSVTKAREVKVEIAESNSDEADNPFMTQRRAVSWAETALR
jgi:hypothetical protein